MARAVRAVWAAREDKSARANFGNLLVLGEMDLLQSILIDGLIGVGVPRCWSSSVMKEKSSTSNSTSDRAKTSTKIMFFAEVLALSEVLFEVLLNSTLTWRNRRLPSPTRINLSLLLSFCPSVRAKRGIWSKRVLIRKIGNLSFSVR